MADTRLSRFTRLEFSPRKDAGDLDFCGGALVVEVLVMSVTDALKPLRSKASEEPSVGGKGANHVMVCCFTICADLKLTITLISLCMWPTESITKNSTLRFTDSKSLY